MESLTAAAVALAVAMVSAPLALALLRGRLVDVPTERSSHVEPTPRGGGLALVAGVAAGWLVASIGLDAPWSGVAFASIALGAIGLVDDVRDVPPTPRLVGQVVVALLSITWLAEGLDVSLAWQVVLAPLTLLWIVSYTNAFNFMDGINGIAAAQMIVAGGLWWIVGDVESLDAVRGVGAITVGASLGFLPFNFPQARIFMGDVGSYFGGALLATVSVVMVTEGVHPIAVVGPLLLFGVDTSVTLLGRIARGEPWHIAHRSHIYQRAVAAGWSHTTMTSAYAVLAAACAVGGGLWVTGSPLRMASGGLLTIAAVGAYVLLPSLASRGS